MKTMPCLKHSHCRGLGLIPDQSMWDLWWTMWQCSPSTLGFPCIIPPSSTIIRSFITDTIRYSQMTVLLNDTLKSRDTTNVEEHDTLPLPIHISLTECIRSQYNEHGCTASFRKSAKWTVYHRGPLLTPLYAPTMAQSTANGLLLALLLLSLPSVILSHFPQAYSSWIKQKMGAAIYPKTVVALYMEPHPTRQQSSSAPLW